MKRWRHWIICCAAIAADQASKAAATAWLRPAGHAGLINGVIGLVYTTNTGASFGMFSGNGRLLGVFSLLCCAAGVWFLEREHSRSPQKGLYLTSLALVVAGAAGNMIDRLLHGYVVDFFNFEFINFAVFNVADACICTGAALLALQLIFDKELLATR